MAGDVDRKATAYKRVLENFKYITVCNLEQKS
jgi:hypothetical protein